jgi:lipopolysaccharide biosynthesis regulator YciM
MELDLGWILVALPVAFGLGWLASRLDLRQMRINNLQAPRAYFKGLNYLLNEQQDQAIDAFIEAVQNDPDTSELHFALGNLFRRRGEYDRAVRVHEHLLSRADLSQADRQRAQHALAQDFLKAGLLDRAEEALRKLEGTSYTGQARLARLAIYERSREWPQATEVAQLLEASGEAQFDSRRAHYGCEQAREAIAQGDQGGGLRTLQETMSKYPQAPRPRILLAQLLESQGQHLQVLEVLAPLFEERHGAAALAAPVLVKAALASQQQERARQWLQALYAQEGNLDILQAALDLAPQDVPVKLGAYEQHLQKHPSLLAAKRWLEQDAQSQARVPAPVHKALEQSSRPLSRYRCAACGFEAQNYFWHCPGCQGWDTYPPRRVEEL